MRCAAIHRRANRRVENCEGCNYNSSCDIWERINYEKDKKRFDFLNSRVHTRETSTLAVIAILVSFSLAILVYAMQQKNPINILLLSSLVSLTLPNIKPLIVHSIFLTLFQNPDLWLFFVGGTLIVAAICYREITIHYRDAEDYEKLSNHLRKPPSTNTQGADDNQNTSEESRCVRFKRWLREHLRGIIIRMALFTILTAWIGYLFIYPIGPWIVCLVFFLGLSIILTWKEPPTSINPEDLSHDS